MEEIRKAHNTFKKELIQSATRDGDLILDVVVTSKNGDTWGRI